MLRYDDSEDSKLKKSFFKSLPFWIGAFLAGTVAVFYAKLFALAEKGAVMIYEFSEIAFLISAPLCFVLAWWLVKKYAPYARGSGIPQVSAAIELSNPKRNALIDSLLSLRVITVKVISSLVLALGGGVIGREGPTIQISASIFKKINDMLPDWYPKISRRNMIVTGAAAGLASAFNTPLGGIVFAIEELTKTHFNLFKSALLTGVIIAGLTALNFWGPYLYLGFPDLKSIPAYMAISIIPLAIITGFAGSGMGKLILHVFKQKKIFTKTYQHVLYAVGGGLIVAFMVVFINPEIMGSGKDIMVSTLFTNDKHMDWYLPFLRIFGVIVTFTSGAAGGIFAPSLSAGAGIGAVFAGLLNMSDPATNLLVLCGMTGFLTSVTRSPFTSSILVLEMTNSHDVIFYIMFTALISNLVALMVAKKSFYDHLKEQYIESILQTEEHPVEPKEKEVTKP